MLKEGADIESPRNT